MAPEQVLGNPRAIRAATCSPIGVMLYEMLTGELPFGDPQTAGGLRQRLWMDPVPPRRLPPRVPRGCRRWCCACSSRRPSTAIRRRST
jgi:serine/threonine protein kinase